MFPLLPKGSDIRRLFEPEVVARFALLDPTVLRRKVYGAAIPLPGLNMDAELVEQQALDPDLQEFTRALPWRQGAFACRACLLTKGGP